MKILIVGSSGMIGTRLFENLLDLDYKVLGVDKNKNKWINELNKNTIIMDLLNKANLKKIPTDIDLIINLAANARVYELVKNPNLALENVIITFNIMEFMRINNLKNIIFASSREVYGNTSKILKVKENEARIEYSESPYSASKIWGEALTWSYCKSYDMKAIVLRFSNVYGMYDDSDRVIPLWIKQALKNENLFIYGKNKILDFTYIDDAVEGLLKTINNFEAIKSMIFNIAFGKGIKLYDIANKIVELTNSNSKIITKKNRPGEIMKFEADISRAKKLLNYKPKINIYDGLLKTIKWYRVLYDEK